MAKGFQKGHKLATGGSHPGVAGPKPGWWKEWCQKAVSSESRLKRLEKFLDQGDFTQFWEVFKFCAESGFGKAQASLAVTAEVTQRRIIINMPANMPEGYLENGTNAIESRNG